MPSTFYEKHPRIQVARGEAAKDLDFEAAHAFEYVDIDTDNDDERELVLTDKGFQAAQKWLRDDSHGGDAA